MMPTWFFDDVDLRSFANTFLINVAKEDRSGLNAYVDRKAGDEQVESAAVSGWVPLSGIDPSVYDACRAIYLKRGQGGLQISGPPSALGAHTAAGTLTPHRACTTDETGIDSFLLQERTCCYGIKSERCCSCRADWFGWHLSCARSGFQQVFGQDQMCRTVRCFAGESQETQRAARRGVKAVFRLEGDAQGDGQRDRRGRYLPAASPARAGDPRRLRRRQAHPL